MRTETTLTIGQLAKRAGLTPSAIRYYESRGLLPEPDREHGQRRYTDDALRRLQIIDVAKRAGFTLDEARALLNTDGRANPAHAELRSLAQRKLPDVEALIQRATAMRTWLITASGCNCETLDVCALFGDGTTVSTEPDLPAPPLAITHVTPARA